MTGSPGTSRKRKAAWALGGLAAFVFVGWIWWEEPPPACPMVTTNLNAVHFSSPPLWDRCIPRTWGWLWRIHDKLFSLRTIALDLRPIKWDSRTEGVIDGVPPEAVQHWITNGFHIWLVQPEGRESLMRNLKGSDAKILSGARIVTGNRIQAQIGVGTPVSVKEGSRLAGTLMTLDPRVLKRFTDLTFVVTATEVFTNSMPVPDADAVLSIHTNFCVAGRATVPGQGCLLLLQENSEGSNRDALGLLILTDAPIHKK